MDREAIYAAVEDADDEELHTLRDHISQVLEKRRLAVKSPERIDRMIEDYQATLGRAGGDPWKPPTSALDTYPRGAVHSHPHQGEDRLWESLISANSHEPGVSGWRLVPKKDEDGNEIPPAFVRPTGSHDSYGEGEMITWVDGNIYRAARNGVVHSPDEYAPDWILVEAEPVEPDPPEDDEDDDGNGDTGNGEDEESEPEPDEPEPEEDLPDEWVQPGGHNPYNTGDRVLWQGSVYESVMDGNAWSPTDHPAGWERQD